MLAITLEPQQQISLFPRLSSDSSIFELEVVKQEMSAEIRLYFLTNKKEKTITRRKRRSNLKDETIFLF
jgi:hypothetical protein